MATMTLLRLLYRTIAAFRHWVSTSARTSGSAPRTTIIGVLPSDQEQGLIDTMLLDGWEQGCWLTDSVSQYSLDAASQHALFDAVAENAPLHREQYWEEQHANIPEALPCDPSQPEEVIWIIVTQRCDLIKGLSQEPTVQLVRATRWLRREAEDRTYNSSYLHIMRVDDIYAWVADFRRLIVVPKTVLRSHQARQCLAHNVDVRRRFSFACAQRTWRRPVPTNIQQRLQKPLASKRKTKSWRNNFFRYISEILVGVDEETGKLIVHAILGTDQVDELQLMRFFDDTVLPYLSEKSGDCVDTDKSEVLPAEQVLMSLVFNTYKLDLDYLSSGEGEEESHF